MELKQGIMTNQELADWFGVSLGTFKNQKKKKIEELKLYAVFTEERGKVNISEIFIPVYDKNLGKTKQIVLEKIDNVWSQDGLDTCSRVGEKIRDILAAEGIDRADRTIINYTIEGRNKLYGKPFASHGTKGSCIYLWCKRDKETGEYSLLNEEEKKIKQDLQTKYFGDATEKQILVKGMVASGEISEEEAWGVLEEMTNMGDMNFLSFLRELESKIHCQVVRGTLVDRQLYLESGDESTF